TLADIPAAEWDELGKLPIVAVWLMGVWCRSPLGREMSLEYRDEYRQVLPDLLDDDIVGSAYCIYDYKVDERFGGAKGLKVARGQLAARGIALILDFVPNHTALDHPWTKEYSEYYVRGNEEEADHHPKDFYRALGGVVARGKDPNYDPWSDVAQLNAFS